MYTDEEITAEININGNTNYITKSNLLSGSQIFAVGDSHTIFYHNSLQIHEHWLCVGKLPLTIYTLLQYGLNIYEVGNLLGNGHEKYNIKQNDYVIFYYGFNDIQKNIHKYSCHDYKNAITNLITNYVQYIVLLKHTYSIKPIISCIYPNPRPNALGQNNYGSYNDRQIYTIFANNILLDLCKKNSIPFLNIYDYITDNDGFIKQEHTADNIHLDYNNKLLRKYVEDIIYLFCE